MVYKFPGKQVVMIFAITAIILSGCSDKERKKAENTYFIEITNCPDSIKLSLAANFKGKTCYHDKNGKLQVMSLNYVTDEYDDMHYYKPIEEVGTGIKDNSKKIRITFSGNYRIDSTYYSIERFKYSGQEWKKVSDLGSIRAISSDRKAKKEDLFTLKELISIITENVSASTY